MKYIKPEVEVIELGEKDVITASFENIDAPEGDWEL